MGPGRATPYGSPIWQTLRIGYRGCRGIPVSKWADDPHACGVKLFIHFALGDFYTVWRADGDGPRKRALPAGDLPKEWKNPRWLPVLRKRELDCIASR